MYAVVSPETVNLPPGTVMRMLGTWDDYQALQTSRGDRALPRLKYCQGEIWLMSPLPKHGRDANLLADIVKILLDSQGRSYEAFSPITLELPDHGGIEPDYCFYIDNWQAVMGKDRINWQIDPPPDLVLEIDVTAYTNVQDYAPYRVPEVWLWQQNQLEIYRLQADVYGRTSTSRFFPKTHVAAVVAECLSAAAIAGTGAALRSLRKSLQG